MADLLACMGENSDDPEKLARTYSAEQAPGHARF
jgi:hypothetical protein